MDFINQIKTLFKRTKDNTQNGGKEPPPKKEKESVANFSMNEGDHGKIFGVSRKVVSGIFIVIVTIFAIAFITATSDDPKQNQRADSNLENEKPASDGTNTMTGLPKDYKNYLDNQNFRRAEERHGANRQQQQQQQAKTEEDRRKQEEARQRAEREAAAARLQNARPSAAELAVNTPNYVAQQQALVAAQMRALEGVQNGGQPQQQQPQRNQAIEFSISNHGNSQPAASNNADAGANGSTGTQYIQTSTGSAGPYKMNAIAPTENSIQAGTVIPATLCTGINSNVDGVVTAIFQYDTYDSMTGNSVLIPAGTKILGMYDGKAASESGRIKIEFTQLIFPNGTSYPISPDTFLAMDGAGYSGIKGKVDHHTDCSISAGAIGAGIAALGSIAAGNVNNSSNTYSAGQLAMQGAMANIINATSSIFQKSANVKDTVSVKPGHSFMIYVANPVQF